jgi:ankyrin repeat protein
VHLFPRTKHRAIGLFDHEITKFLGRSLPTWLRHDRGTILYKAPKSYVKQLLQYCIGRGQCELAKQMHSVIDVLVQQFDIVGAHEEYHEVFDLVCDALAAKVHPGNLFLYKRPEHWNPVPTAFVVAIRADYTDVIDNMLEMYPTVPYDRENNGERPLAATDAFDMDPRLPLEMAMVLGRAEQVKMLWRHGAQIDTGYMASPLSACKRAAKNGHEEVVELYLKLLPWNLNDKTLNSAGKVMLAAASAHRWDIVRCMLKRDKAAMQSDAMKKFWIEILSGAAKDGQDDVVGSLLSFVPSFSGHTFPLQRAACGGHLSTCELLLKKGKLPKEGYFQDSKEIWAQGIACGGSVEVCQLLRQHNLWSPQYEYHFLPLAAENGHLQFAKFAIKNGHDADPFTKGRPLFKSRNDRKVRYRYDVRYFALLRAIVSGHQGIVRWLIEGVGIKVSKNSRLANPELRPVDLAVYADDSEMVKLLLSLGAEAQSSSLEQCAECQKVTETALSLYRHALYLSGDDYNRRWYRRRRSRDGEVVCHSCIAK